MFVKECNEVLYFKITDNISYFVFRLHLLNDSESAVQQRDFYR